MERRRKLHRFFTEVSILLILLLLGTAGGAKALINNPYYLNPVLDPALQPKYVNEMPNPLVPPFVLTPDKTTYPGIDYYTVSAKQIQQQSGLVDETTGQPLTTTYWGYGDARATATTGLHSFPGPTFEVRSNSPTRVRWLNELPNTQLVPIDKTIPCGSVTCPEVAIVTHVHGAHVQGDSDGGPFAWFSPNFAMTSPLWDPNTAYGLPGTYSYPNTQEAATVWYHDHAQRFTHTNVYAGLAGFYLIRDANEDAMQANGTLPKYPYEVPIVIQDRDFYPNGALALPDQPLVDLLSPLCQIDPMTGAPDPATCPVVTDPATGLPNPSITAEFFGGIIQVNGIVWPKLSVEPRPYRLRFLNGSDSRTYFLQFADAALNPLPGIKFYQIGTDQGFLNAPVARTQMIVMPGERYDVLVDFTGVAPGTRLILQNVGPDGPYNGELPGSMNAPPVVDPNTVGQIMAFDVNLPVSATAPSQNPATITSLRPAPVPTLTATAGIPSRKLFLQEVTDQYGRLTLTLNGKGMMEPVSEIPALNNTEIWEFANNTPDAHPIHLHLVQFQVLDRTTFDTAAFVPPMPGAEPVWTLTGLPVAPPPEEQGWKDTIQMTPGTVTRVIAKFDIAGSYVYHCHILSHEENDMMRPFVVSTTPTSMKPIVASVASPQAVATAVPVTFSVEATTTAQVERSADAYEYRLLIQPPGGAMTPTGPYSSIHIFKWSPPAVPGTYKIRAEARAYGSANAFDVFASMDYVLTGNLSGVISDPLTGLPVAGATVTATPGGASSITDATGTYAFSLSAGAYALSVTAPGMGTSSGNVTVGATGTFILNLPLTIAANGIAAGKVSVGGIGFAGATVTAVTAAGPGLCAITDNEGNYALSLAPGVYKLVASAMGYNNATIASVTVTAGAAQFNLNMTLTISTNGTLSGTVKDNGTNLPIAGAELTADPGGYFGVTSATGGYSFILPAGNYTLTVNALNYTSKAVAVTVTKGATTTADVSLVSTANGKITGKVTTGNPAKPLAGVWVETDPGCFNAITDATGAYSISVPPGKYTVRTTILGYANALTPNDVIVPGGVTTSGVDFSLVPAINGKLTGRITSAQSKQSLVGAVVTLMPGGYQGTTNSTGNYTIRAPSGNYLVLVSMPGFKQGTGNITIKPCAAASRFSLAIEPSMNGIMTGTVTAASSGMSVPFAIVTLNPGGFTAVTSSTGAYTISVPPAAYRVTVVAKGYRAANWPTRVLVEPGKTTSAINFALVSARKGVITGTVTSALTSLTGTGVSGVTVTATSTTATAMPKTAAKMGDNAVPMGPTATDMTAVSDGMGNFAINVPPGTYTISTNAANFVAATSMVTVAEDMVASTTLDMEDDDVTGESEVSVHDINNGIDLPGAEVTIEPGGLSAVTGDDGDFYVNLEPGTYTITVNKPGYQAYSTTTEVVAGQVMTVEADLTPTNPTPSSNNSGGGGGGCFISIAADSPECEGMAALAVLAVFAVMLLPFAMNGRRE